MICSPELLPGRVSLIVPCYNVEKYLDDFIASIIAQTYKTLEIILINDGANEATTKALREAVPRLEAEGYCVLLIEQVNKGLAGAVDTGLKRFTGEFLMWPDPDDWLLPHSIERRIQIMRENPDIGLLRSNAKLFIEARQEFDGHFMSTEVEPHRPVELFEDLLFQRQFYAPVCHIVRSAMFLQVHPDRSIWFAPVSSQNFQLLVPLVEVFPVLQVHEAFAVYRVREDSRSRAPTKTLERLMDRHEQLYDVTLHTLPKLRTYSEERAAKVRNHHWRNKMLPTAIRAKMRDKAFDLIRHADLSAWRKALVRLIFRLRCNCLFDSIDTLTGRVASRGLARFSDILVRMPNHEICWGAGPIWSGR